MQCAVFGMPWDGGASFRPGARFGPEAIRSASGMIRTYNADQGVQVFGELSTIDYGDAPTVPGYIEDTLERIDRVHARRWSTGGRRHRRHGRRSLLDARRAARTGARARTARAGALRLAHRPVGQLLRPPVRARDDVPARHRGGRGRSGAGRPGRHARAAVRRVRRGHPRGARRRYDPVARARRARPRASSPTGCATGSATGRRSSPSTSTSSMRRSLRAPGRPRLAARRASRRCPTCGRSPACRSSGSTWWRCRRSTTGRGRSPRCSGANLIFDMLAMVASRSPSGSRGAQNVQA